MSHATLLLSYLAKDQPELTTTKTLFYLLSVLEPARAAIRQMLLNKTGVDIGESLHYATQKANEDGGVPDIQAQDIEGATRLLIEAKFYAGLTDSQPVAYLDSLPPGGILLFVVPRDRQISLWKQALERVAAAGMHAEKKDDAGLSRLALVEGKLLGLTNWRNLNTRLRNAALASGDTEMLHVVNQLAALCEQQEDESYVPLTGQELTSACWKKLVPLAKLTGFLASMLFEAHGLASKPTKGGSDGTVGYYIDVKGYECFIHVKAHPCGYPFLVLRYSTLAMPYRMLASTSSWVVIRCT